MEDITMRTSASAALLLTLMVATGARAQVNMGAQKAEASLPFNMTKVASFDTQIWRMAFLPDGRFLAAEKAGRLWPMARARRTLGDNLASLDGLQVLWRDPAGGRGGEFGAHIAFAPDGNSLFLSSGDRQRMTPAQDPNSPLGKILHLTLDCKPAPGNPQAGKTGAATIDIINPPRNTEVAKTAPVVKTYTFPGPNLTPSETWTSGHRTP